MWKPEHRLAGERRGLRYPSDMNDSEWTLIAPLIPPSRRGGILVDTLGLLLGVSVLPANLQDRDATRDLLSRARRRFPFIERIFADAGYQGPKMAKTIATTGRWKIEIVKRSDLHRFVVLPKRWIVERTFAWISRNRRLTRDFERYARTVAAFVRLAMIRIMLKRLIKPSHCS